MADHSSVYMKMTSYITRHTRQTDGTQRNETDVTRRKQSQHIDSKNTNPLTPTVAIRAIKHSVPDRVKASFVIFDMQVL